MRNQSESQTHPFEPVYDAHSRVLILGSFPSVRSRAEGFYYGNPQNRFWQLMGLLHQDMPPADTRGKVDWLLRHRIALFDVLASCDIRGSSDASIKNARVNDLGGILRGSEVTRVFCNGKAAGNLYVKHQLAQTGIPAVVLPSTSPANAAWTLERLVEAWRLIL